MDELEAHGGRIRRAIEGRCVMGIVQTPSIARLAASVSRMAAPRVELTITSIDTPLQVRAMTDGSIDVAIGHAFPFATTPPNLTREPLATGRLDTAILPAGHRLAGRPSVRLHDLAGEPLVFMERSLDPDFHDLVLEAFALNGLVPTRGPAYRSLEVIWAMVAEGQGWTLGGDAQQDEPPGGTVGVVISDFSLPWGIDLLFAAGETRPTVLMVLDFVREAARQDLSREARSADRPGSLAGRGQNTPGSRRPTTRRQSRST
jgi:DNA-binding transcriptional LysR family regulator